jgi:sec-independent protein translocase protein TatB
VFDISFTELMLIGVVALVVIGPERLPKVARTVGHLLGRAQRYVNDVKGDIQREVELDELRKMKDEMESAARSMQTSVQQTQAELARNLKSPVDEFKADFESLKHSSTKPELSSEQTDLSASSSGAHNISGQSAQAAQTPLAEPKESSLAAEPLTHVQESSSSQENKA